MPEDWEAAFSGALRKGDPLAASTILRNTGENGWVRKPQWARARELIDRVAPAPFVRRDWAARLFAHPRRADRELAALLLEPLVASHRAEVDRAVLRLARDDRWDVREAGAALLGEALDRDFEHWLGVCREHMARPDPRVRRAIAGAAGRAARRGAAGRAAALLDLLEPALRDTDQYVRRTVGRSTIGEHLLRAYPEETLARLAGWARSDDETVRWNVAMALTTAAAARHADRAVEVLRLLVRDASRAVSRAAASALRRVERRRPGAQAG